MLLQVTFAFTRVRAVRVLAVEFVRYRAMFIVEMPVSLLFGWPAMLMVLALWFTAFPWTRMGLLMLTAVSG